MKPTWISTHKLMTRATKRWLECVKTCQSGKLSCLGLHCQEFMYDVRIMVPINVCHLNANFCMNVYFNKSEIFVDVHVTIASVLTSNVLFKKFDIMILRNFLHTCLLQIWDNFYTPNARWLAYCDLHILSVRSGRGAQLLSCSHLVDHTNIPLIFQMNCIGQRSFGGDK